MAFEVPFPWQPAMAFEVPCSSKPQAALGGSKRGRQRRTGTGSAAGGPQRAVQEQLEDGKSDVSMSPNAASVAGGSQPGRSSN